jgi:hypothetical protein
MEQTEASSINDSSVKIAIDYIKSNSFRVVHLDGALGFVTPNLNICLNLYSERPSIPKRVVYTLNESGSLGEEVIEEREDRDSIVREVEASAIVDLSAAKYLISVLEELVEEIEQRLIEQPETEND